MKRIAVVAEYDPKFPPHIETDNALDHSAVFLKADVEYEWISTEGLTIEILEKFDGMLVGPGSPYKIMNRTIEAIRYARENDIPLLGTCGGFQHVVIEIARNLIGFKDADHAEYDPYASNLFISKLSCSLAGREMNLKLEKGSMVHGIYGKDEVKERYYCNFGVNPDYIEELKKAPVKFSGSDDEGEIRIIEIRQNRFFVATLFVPQIISTEENPHPIINSFISSL